MTAVSGDESRIVAVAAGGHGGNRLSRSLNLYTISIQQRDRWMERWIGLGVCDIGCEQQEAKHQ